MICLTRFSALPVCLAALLPGMGGARAFAEEGAIPAPVTAGDFRSLLERPPFRRMLTLSDSLVLSGVAVIPGGEMVTVWNRASGESFLVGSVPNPQGWRLVELQHSTDLRSVAAIISSGSQELTLRFDPERLTPPKLDNTSKPGARPESQVVVEALLRSLDPEASKSFEALPSPAQEKFRTAFAGYLDAYPTAGDAERRGFVQRTLAETAAGADPAPAPEGEPPVPALAESPPR